MKIKRIINGREIETTMNEIMIETKSGWMYFATAKNTARTAFKDFLKSCETNGLNVDNMDFLKITLRDAEGHDIDQMDRFDLKVERITVDQLIERMKKMECGDVIGLACGLDNDYEPYDWFGILKIDMSKLDESSNTWVMQYFGGSNTPRIFSDYDDGMFLAADLRKGLEECDLLHNGMVLIDVDDL